MENNVILKQGCHSQAFVLGIFRIRNARGVKQAKGYEEDPRALRVASSGRTTYLNVGQAGERFARGFTLIELLVVVLIIGVLAAVALPQYQKAVEHTRAMEALSILKTVHQANQSYYLIHGKYAEKFEQLDVQIPWTGKTAYLNSGSGVSDSLSNDTWSLQLVTKNPYATVTLGIFRLTGKYRGSGFMVTYSTAASLGRPFYQILCLERVNADSLPFAFDKSLGAGAYCEKIIRGKFVTGSDTTWNRVYTLP